ncbi:hypothetical protein ACQ86D_00015 [Streptomyces galilaeus]
MAHPFHREFFPSQPQGVRDRGHVHQAVGGHDRLENLPVHAAQRPSVQTHVPTDGVPVCPICRPDTALHIVDLERCGQPNRSSKSCGFSMIDVFSWVGPGSTGAGGFLVLEVVGAVGDRVDGTA